MKKVEDFDFEELLANSANELRMRPSQQVWKAINRRLHQRRKVYAAAVLLLLLGLFTALNNLPDKTNNNTSIAGTEQPAATTQPLTNNQAVATRPQNATVRNRMVTREEPVIRQLGSSGSNSTLAASVNNIPGPTTNSRAGIPAPVSRQENIAQTTTPVNYTTPSETENEEEVPSVLQAKQIVEYIRMMPSGYRTVLNLYAIEGYSHREIAELLEIEESTSRSQYTRAKAMLEDILVKKKIINKTRFSERLFAGTARP